MAIGRVDLGLSEWGFWALTPREFRALADRFDEGQRRTDGRFGLLAELVAGALGWKSADGGPMTAADYFPSLRAPVKATVPDTRPASIVLEDSIADGVLAWARNTEEIARTKGLGPS